MFAGVLPRNAETSIPSQSSASVGGRLNSEGPPHPGRPLRNSGLLGGSAAEGDRVDQVGVAELPERLTLDQPDALPGQPQDLPGLAEAQRLPVLQSVAQRDHVAFALVEHLVDRAADLLAEQLILDL